MKILQLFVYTLVSHYATASPAHAITADTALDSRQGPNDLLNFLCDKIPDVCTNMCYGAICEGIGSILVYDKASTPTKRQRRKTAGCIESGGNRCSTKKGADPGQQCDEYPFASTSDGSIPDRINKCVPAEQNRSQGGSINAFYRGSFCAGGPCTFRVGFANAGNLPYCQNQCPADRPDDIVNPSDPTPPGPPADDEDAEDGTDLDEIPDGEEEPEKRAVTLVAEVFKYKTMMGLEVFVPGGAEIGQRAWFASPKNTTLWDEAINRQRESEDEEDKFEDLVDLLTLNEDFIVERIY